jgi:hypothetical protein
LLIDIPAVPVLYCRGTMHEYLIRCSLHVVVYSTIEETDMSSPLITTIRHACAGITSNSCPRQASDSSCHKASVFQLFQQIHSTNVGKILFVSFVSLSYPRDISPKQCSRFQYRYNKCVNYDTAVFIVAPCILKFSNYTHQQMHFL